MQDNVAFREFKFNLKKLKLPLCELDSDHDQEPISQVCIQENCPGFLMPICNDCISENKHDHTANKFISFKALLKELDFQQTQFGKNTGSNNSLNSSQELDGSFDMSQFDMLAKECKIMADQMYKLVDEIMDLKQNYGQKQRKKIDNLRQILDNLTIQQNSNRQFLEENLQILKDFIKIKDQNEIKFSQSNQQQIQLEQEIKYTFQHLNQKVNQAKSIIKQNFLDSQSNINLNFTQYKPIEFYQSRCCDSANIINVDNKGFIFGNNTRYSQTQQIYSPIFQNGTNTVYFKINEVYPKQGTYFWIALIQDGKQNDWFSGNSLCSQQVLNTNFSNMVQSQGEKTMSQIYLEEDMVEFQCIIDFQNDVFAVQNLKHNLEFKGQGFTIRNKKVRLVFGINDQLRINFQVLGVRQIA